MPLLQPAASRDRTRSGNLTLLVYALLAVYVLILLRTAWVSDDAYINFRTIDNFLNGYGLRWNVSERVQTFTDPLWVLLLSAAIGLTHDFYFTTLALSIALSVGALVLLARSVARGPYAAVLVVVLALTSKAFVDFSTGGLENPLSNLLLVAFFAVYWREAGAPAIGSLALLAALAVLARPDTLLLLAPSLAVAWWEAGWKRGTARVAAGFAPLVAWGLFSVVYYGFPLPNTAYAKLWNGPGFGVAEQGFCYLLDSANLDPVTLAVIGAGMAATFVLGQRRDWAVAAGILLSLTFTVRIGGDFMSGRFLVAPFLCAVLLLSRLPWNSQPLAVAVAGALALVAAVSSPDTPLLTGHTLHHDFRDLDGVVDERRVYYPYTGLLNLANSQGPLNHPWGRHGQEVRASGEKVSEYQADGFFGFTAGPGVHAVDPFALGDVLLSHLPSEPNWRPGHFRRRLPAGYLDTLKSGRNQIAEPAIARYYEDVRQAVSAPLFTRQRMQALWRLNTGGEQPVIASSTYGRQRIAIGDAQRQRAAGGPGFLVGEGGLEVALGGHQGSVRRLELGLGIPGVYALVYRRDGRDIATQVIDGGGPHEALGEENGLYTVVPPAGAEGCDAVLVRHLAGYNAFLRSLEVAR